MVEEVTLTHTRNTLNNDRSLEQLDQTPDDDLVVVAGRCEQVRSWMPANAVDIGPVSFVLREFERILRASVRMLVALDGAKRELVNRGQQSAEIVARTSLKMRMASSLAPVAMRPLCADQSTEKIALLWRPVSVACRTQPVCLGPLACQMISCISDETDAVAFSLLLVVGYRSRSCTGVTRSRSEHT